MPAEVCVDRERDVDDLPTAAQKILFLVQRLHRSLAPSIETP